MEELSRDYLIDFYRKGLLIHGDRPEALRWSPEGQRLRYALMMEVAPKEELEGSRVLDLGSGKGDFYAYLKTRGVNVRYSGYDITPELVELARQKHPEADFKVRDIEKTPLTEEFDYSFSCGVFNNRLEDTADTARRVLCAMFENTRRAVVFNALSTYAPHRERDLYYHDPVELLQFALGYLTPFASVRHDRLDDDFTLFLYKERTRDAGARR